VIHITEIRDDADAAVDYVPEDGGDDDDEEIEDEEEEEGVSLISSPVTNLRYVPASHVHLISFLINSFLLFLG
jgi:hypothetical protein